MSTPGNDQPDPQQPDPPQQNPYSQQNPYAQGPGPYATSPQGPYLPQPGAFPPGPPPPAPKRKGRRVLITVGSIVVALVIAFGVRMIFAAVNGTSSAQVGDCLQYREDGNRTKVVDCGSAEATHKIFGITANLRACADVAGTQIALEVGDDRVFCFGAKDLDPATAINAAQKGDCLTIVGEEAKKAPCGAGTYPVLEVIKDRVKASGDDNFETACAGVENAEGAYAWSISTSEDEPVGTWDRIFCLGAQRE